MVEQQTTWTIFMCHLFCFSFCWWELIGRFIVGTVFSSQVFFRTLRSLFVVLFHFQERKKAQQARQLSRCYWESPYYRFCRVYWIIIFFSLLQKNLLFWHMKLLFYWKYHKTLKIWKILNHWEFFHTLAVTIYSTIITLRPTRRYGTTTMQEKTESKVTET